jgi:hypothetical protein
VCDESIRCRDRGLAKTKEMQGYVHASAADLKAALLTLAR